MLYQSMKKSQPTTIYLLPFPMNAKCGTRNATKKKSTKSSISWVLRLHLTTRFYDVSYKQLRLWFHANTVEYHKLVESSETKQMWPKAINSNIYRLAYVCYSKDIPNIKQTNTHTAHDKTIKTIIYNIYILGYLLKTIHWICYEQKLPT